MMHMQLADVAIRGRNSLLSPFDDRAMHTGNASKVALHADAARQSLAALLLCSN